MLRRLLILSLVLAASPALPALRSVTTVSGDGAAGFNDGPIRGARWNFPYGACADFLGNVYVADSENHVIRVVAPGGDARIVAGRLGSPGVDDGPPNVARFRSPLGVACGSDGALYVADTGNHSIRRIDLIAGNVSTFAGRTGVPGWADGTRDAARFATPSGLGVDARGYVYVADSANDCIREITPLGDVRTFAGRARVAGSQDGFADGARFAFPFGIAVLPTGELLVTDSGNSTIRLVSANGSVRTLAGIAGSPGRNDGDAASARFSRPTAVVADSAGNIVVADSENSLIRLISRSGVVSTLAGTGAACFRDGVASSACFERPGGLALYGSRIYVVDTFNHAIRAVDTLHTRGRGIRR